MNRPTRASTEPWDLYAAISSVCAARASSKRRCTTAQWSRHRGWTDRFACCSDWAVTWECSKSSFGVLPGSRPWFRPVLQDRWRWRWPGWSRGFVGSWKGARADICSAF